MLFSIGLSFLKKGKQKIRRQLEILQPQRHWVNRQQEGEGLDLESYVNFLADRKYGRVDVDIPVYRNLHRQSRVERAPALAAIF